MIKDTPIIDFHAHVVPHADHGCQDASVLASQLSLMKKHGTDTVVATPHFYPHVHRVPDFISRVNSSLQELDPHTLEGVRSFLKDMKEPVKKILDAGLSFGYHNHAFEFDDIGGTDMFEILIEEAPEFNFILDTYWVTKGGHNPVDYINRLSGRILNLHFKDMDKTENRGICACGDGIIDFVPIIAAAEKAGIRYGLVEQDNAPSMADPLGEMAKSCKHLTPLVYHN